MIKVEIKNCSLDYNLTFSFLGIDQMREIRDILNNKCMVSCCNPDRHMAFILGCSGKGDH